MNQIGEVIHIGPGAHFRLEREIAKASFGEVWAATWVEAGSRVALKMVRQDEMAAYPEFADVWPASLQREIAFLQTVRAPHLVYFIRHGHWQGLPVLVLEEMDTSLSCLMQADHLQSSVVPYTGSRQSANPAIRQHQQALHWLRQIANGLAVLHGHGLRHLDLKPHNLLLTKDFGPGLGRRIKVADFGECKNRDEVWHQVVGTPGWQAPEQFFPLPDFEHELVYQTDHRADLFALGLLYFFMVTGQKTEFALCMMQLHQQAMENAAWLVKDDNACHLSAQDRDRFMAGAPAKAWGLLQALLAHQPAQRPDSAQTVIHMIDSLV
ncbi:MAG: hypothetical protein RL748_3600 [Pseudomonadota bacterium]|jgi:serine/threonine protein kinase